MTIKNFIISTLSNFQTALSKVYQKKNTYSYQSGFISGPNWYHVASANALNNNALIQLPVIFSCTAGWYSTRPCAFIVAADAIYKTIGNMTVLHKHIYNASDVAITECRLSYDDTSKKYYIDVYITVSAENKFHYKIDDNRSWTIMPLTAVTEDETLTTLSTVSLL